MNRVGALFHLIIVKGYRGRGMQRRYEDEGMHGERTEGMLFEIRSRAGLISMIGTIAG